MDMDLARSEVSFSRHILNRKSQKHSNPVLINCHQNIFSLYSVSCCFHKLPVVGTTAFITDRWLSGINIRCHECSDLARFRIKHDQTYSCCWLQMQICTVFRMIDVARVYSVNRINLHSKNHTNNIKSSPTSHLISSHQTGTEVCLIQVWLIQNESDPSVRFVLTGLWGNTLTSSHRSLLGNIPQPVNGRCKFAFTSVSLDFLFSFINNDKR